MLIAAVGTIQALLCALVVAGATPWLKPRLEAAAMAGRPLPIVLVAALPFLTGWMLITAALGPSLFAGVGLGTDHCLVHLDHAIHLCLSHLPSTAPTLALSAVAAVGAAISLSASWRVGTLMFRGRSEARSLASIAREHGDVRWIESPLPLALTAGLARPRVYVSSGLERGLDDIELGAAIAHERCHARERHALLKMAAMVLGMFHLPSVRRELASLLDLACERRADESAAEEVVDRVRVASALIRAHRLVAARPSTILAMTGDSPSHLEKRVRALLDERAPGRRRSWTAWVLTSAVALPVIANHELHHAVEHVLALLA